MESHCVALGGNPGIQSLGIGDIWRRLLAKYNFVVAGPSVKDTCGSDQFFVGLSAGIQGTLYSMSQTWTESEAIDQLGFSSC